MRAQQHGPGQVLGARQQGGQARCLDFGFGAKGD